MSWFRCDDQLADHPKVMALGPLRRPALGLWTMCGTYSARHLTDGFVSRAVVAQYADRDLHKLTAALVAAGLFDEVEGGWVLHDYLDWNPSRDEVLDKRAKVQAAGRAGGLAKARASARADANGSLGKAAYSRPVPTRPPANAGDARDVDRIEVATRRLRNGNASERQVDTMRGLFEQVGDDARCFAVLAQWEHSPVADRYGRAMDELRQVADERKRYRGSRAVTPTTSYDRLMETDDDSSGIPVEVEA